MIMACNISIAVDCGFPGNILNGAVDISRGTEFGSTALYSCDPGFQMMGMNSLTCLANGKWNRISPTCLGKWKNQKNGRYC